MKHCLVLAPFLLSSAVAFTAVNQQFQAFVKAPGSTTALKVANFDYHGTSDRIGEAYKEWCRVYNKTDQSRLEIFAYHFLLAEKFFGQTGAPIKLNEFADLTSAEYMALQEKGSLPQVAPPTEVVVSETKASDYAVPEPVAPANYGTSAASYLDALSSQSQASNTLSGAGMTSYLDTVPTNGSILGGSGMTSYLDTVSGAAPLSNAYATGTSSPPPAPAAYVAPAPYVPPPAAAAPPAPAAPSTPVASSGNYMDNLSSASSTTRGAGIKSYLDSVPANAAVRGSGMTSYLDSVAGSTYTPFQAPAAAAAPQPYVPPPAQPYVPPPAPAAEVAQPVAPPPAPAQPYVPAESNTVASRGGNYMDNLSTSAGSTTPRGAGISSYLDTVSSNSARQGGVGMTSYLNNMGKASDFATIETTGTPVAPYVPPPPATTPPPAAAVPQPVQQAAAAPQPVQQPVAPAAPVAPLVVPQRSPSYVPPRQSRNVPGGHWMDTVTPISSYGSHGVNGEWDDSNYQAANDRYNRRRAAKNYQQAQAAAYTVGQQYQKQPSYKEESSSSSSSQEPIEPLAERVQRRQKRQIETFGGGFIIS
ncbi:unnamed protein product [Cylindrotheca closterium]|uniref:Uncharacterized protein n=1 Tax=Cylindrotheca closterium TaxID=2856 RepID=A0AAD2FLJ7_9STRA|nr:unnamed protein product [Cylindrotheca closterium]